MNFKGTTSISVMEMSHRSKDFIAIAEDAELGLWELLAIPKNFHLFFLSGGATLQFSAIPYNLLGKSTQALYLTTGAWSLAAKNEAEKYCKVLEVGDINPKL